MAKPIGIQLYSLREYSEVDFLSVLKGVAEIGYTYVEPAGLFNFQPTEFIKVLGDLGLKMVSSHTPWATLNSVAESMEIANQLGLKRVVTGYGPDDFKDLDTIKNTAEITNQMWEALNRNGFELFIHNHYWEFRKTPDGRYNYDVFAELCPNVKFELDCFWSTNFGLEDPVAIAKKYAPRTILYHMKDGVCSQPQLNSDNLETKNGFIDPKADMMPLGTGTLPIKDLIAVAPEHLEAVIVELDYYNIEMWDAVRQSYKYMTENGLATGNK